jgi:beta-glucosidase-like glycosyl hydrolase/CubicO group peptidase (beta-lactamase class C family)
MRARFSLVSLLFLFISMVSKGQNASAWADSVMKTLSPDEKIAQLIMVRLSSIDSRTRTVTFYDSTVERDIRKWNIGGICLFQGAPVKQATIVNRLQSIAKTPILMAIDGENGVGMRLDSVAGLPRMMMLGALRDTNLVYRYGSWVAEQCRQLGIQVNFAPVVDVNNNPNNPVINDRSFGENKYKVATMGIQYMLGMRDKGVMGSAKHFPGHGDVDVDSHLAMPVISKSKEQLDSLELYPFQKIFDAGIGSAMIGHLFIPSIDSNTNRVASVSRKSVTKLLKEEMGFKGITFTDALEMKGVADAFPDHASSVESLIAGNDILCLPGDVEKTILKIKGAIAEGVLSWKQIDEHVKNVLKAKFATGLAQWKPLPLEGLAIRLNEKTDGLKKEIAEKAITLAKLDDKTAFPLPAGRSADGLLQTTGATESINKTGQTFGNYALLEIGRNRNTAFAAAIRKNYNADVFMFDNSKTSTAADSLMGLLKNYDKIIVALHELPRFPANNFGISKEVIRLVNTINASTSSSLFIFGNPYAAKSFCDAKNIMICYEDDAIVHEAAAKMLSGALPTEGTLPVSVCTALPAGTGINLPAIAKQIVSPKKITTGGNDKMAKVDSIIQDAIRKKAAPGMALLVIKDGKIIEQKTYGNMSYDAPEKVTQESVYDMASVTKICATTLSIMKLYDEKKIRLDGTLGDYIPWVRGSNKANITLREVLLHQAGLKAWIPFYKEISDSITMKAKPGYFSKSNNSKYNVKVDDSLYMRTDWRDTMISRILTSSVDARKPYIYSDNDFIFLGEVVKAVSGQSLDQYAWNNFYRPLGFRSTGFNPTAYINKKTIAPTEQDPYFRERLVRGYVHDPGAAMFGGVSGHAGLFSNAYEIAVLMEIIMNKGVINEKRFFSTATIDLFNSYQSDISRRGLGFDKPEKDNATRKVPYPALNISSKTFGHTGFTGTCAWADPEKGLVFVLLANRVHPTAKNTFGDLNVRGKVMEELWK